MPFLRYITLEKPVGETPLETLSVWKSAHPEYAGMPASYAGRLDPMASGKLLILLGDECKRRDAYTGLDKEYEIEVVLGAATDTGDALGRAELKSPLPINATQSHLSERAILKALRALSGTHHVPYPAFSSKTVNGKPLFQYALEGTLDSISIPEHDETVYRAQLLKTQQLDASALHARIRKLLAHAPHSDDPRKTLGADFRQDEIRARWEKLLTHGAFTVLTLRISCASGTYMRTFAARLGAALGTSGFALSIHRTRIGRYVPLGPLGFWRMQFLTNTSDRGSP